MSRRSSAGESSGVTGPSGIRGQPIGDVSTRRCADLAELARLHVERRPPVPECFHFRDNTHLSPSNKSDSCARPAIHAAEDAVELLRPPE